MLKLLNTLQKDYTLNSRSYQLKLPLEVDVLIPDNDCVRLLSQFVEEMDLTDLYETYSVIRKNQATPRQMLKILLYAYHEGIYSSRMIESACKRDINFMYLLEGKPAPDHTTIARFRTLHFRPCAVHMLSLTVGLLDVLGELSGEQIFIDGTKIEANANKYTFVWKKAVTKNQQKLFTKIEALVADIIESYGLKPLWECKITIRRMKKLRKKLYRIKQEENIVFVHGRGCRKTPLQRHIEQLEAYLQKLKEYTQKLHICGDRSSYSKTDKDATFMRMKEDHMLNGQLKPGYNLQIGADAGYIAWLTVSNHPTDTLTLKPFVDEMMRMTGLSYRTVVADAGYESEANYSYLENRGIRAMIKPTNYEISKTKKYQKDISRRENMGYNPDGDYYTCKRGKRLYACANKKRKDRSGYIRKTTIYKCHECKDCPIKEQCIKGRNWKVPEDKRFKSLEISRKFERQRKASLALITSDEGCELRMNRSIQAEGVFALIKEDQGFRKFLCRGQANVLAESVLLAIAHNIGLLHRKIQNDRIGIYLHPLKTA